LKILFCCCKDDVYIQIGELKIQPKDAATRDKIRWWLLDMAVEVIGDVMRPFEKAKNDPELGRAYMNLKKLKEDLEALQSKAAEKIES